LYAGHKPFTGDLTRLRDRYRSRVDGSRELPPLPFPPVWEQVLRFAQSRAETKEYIGDVTKLAARWALDRLPEDLGRSLIHEWIKRPNGLSFGAGHMTRRPAMGSAAGIGRIEIPFVWLADEHRDAWHDEDSKGIDGDIGCLPPGSSVLAGPQGDVRRRLLAMCEVAVDAELERIAGLHEERGYRFPDSRPDRDRHLAWWFKRHALGTSCAQIGNDDPDLKVSEGAVRRATDAITRTLSRPRRAQTTDDGTITVDHTGAVVS